ncbi:MAG: prephenate dehydrogenase [SAR86 cluster bacterium]|nr:prephenate dehydrogenase [SAR86 cluster bacterium]
MNSFLIIGSGFMGHSLALALKEKNEKFLISATEISKNHRYLLSDSKIYENVYRSYEDVDKNFDIVLLCTPPLTTSEIYENICKKFAKSLLITDICSTKSFLKEKVFPDNYVSSHPICGSDKNGPAEAKVDLYKKNTCILIGEENQSFEICVNMWQLFDMKIFKMSGEEHDQIYCHSSHLPHIIGRAFFNYLESKKIPEKFLGNSSREMIRIGSSNKELWNQIFKGNKKNLKISIDEFQEYLNNVKNKL